ncbi:RagB/SusD family nutrient uptake outer membrane protein [Hymenobacter volaticus]|uniref:RagB/SusD family nutrient uptake outer membrane protein n=1 Tax=Hymenobacter volaticus TaxID=2932254 RepID=UPI00287FF44C|nr:RagB/SusD family nutrient uptake outer membrane protein [Hymenobacter volaticus]
MKSIKTYAGLTAALVLAGLSSCTDLDETLYDRTTADNFLQTKNDVYRVFLRTFEHGYNTIQGAPYQLQELSADQLMTPNREGDWFDGGQYARAHYHTWTIQEGYINDTWTLLNQGIVLATNSLEDIQALDPARFNLPVAEQKQLIAELRVMRAWYHLRLLDLFRNIQLVTKVKGEKIGPAQSTPQEAYAFIETELKEALPDLLAKGDQGTAQFQGRWTKAGAAALLGRLYLNANVYIGQDHYADCATVCQDIISGKYGSYAVESRWDAPFDWNNDQSSETIFAFPGSFGRSHWQYEGVCTSGAFPTTCRSATWASRTSAAATPGMRCSRATTSITGSTPSCRASLSLSFRSTPMMCAYPTTRTWATASAKACSCKATSLTTTTGIPSRVPAATRCTCATK